MTTHETETENPLADDAEPVIPKLTLSFPEVIRFDGETYLFVWLDEENLHAFRYEGYPEDRISGVYTHIEKGADDVLHMTHSEAMAYAETEGQFQARKAVQEGTLTAKFAVGDHVITDAGESAKVIEVDSLDPERIKIEYTLHREGWTFDGFLSKAEPVADDLVQMIEEGDGIVNRRVSSFTRRQEERAAKKRAAMEPIATQEIIETLKGWSIPEQETLMRNIINDASRTDAQKGEHLRLLMGHGPNGKYVNWEKVVTWLKDLAEQQRGEALLNHIRHLNLNVLSPIDALTKLYELKRIAQPLK